MLENSKTTDSYRYQDILVSMLTSVTFVYRLSLFNIYLLENYTFSLF